jgi:hypothetical protein
METVIEKTRQMAFKAGYERLNVLTLFLQSLVYMATQTHTHIKVLFATVDDGLCMINLERLKGLSNIINSVPLLDDSSTQDDYSRVSDTITSNIWYGEQKYFEWMDIPLLPKNSIEINDETVKALATPLSVLLDNLGYSPKTANDIEFSYIEINKE